MTAVKGTTLKTEFKAICDRVVKGEVFIVTRPRDENIVIISEQEYRQLQRAKAYANHLSLSSKVESGAEATYPQGFFDLFGSGNELGLNEAPNELMFESDSKRESL